MAVEVKICGMTQADDVRAAVDCGADYVGFVLYAGSPRGITAKTMRKVLRESPACRAVGVFVNETRETVQAIAEDCGLYAVQVHGDEDPEEFADYPRRLWRAVRLSRAGAPERADAWQAERYVIDAAVPGVYGGSGVRADWAAAGDFARQHPVMLAGGLTADNVAEAVQTVQPLGVDVSSGVERGPGRKDHANMKRFIERAKA